MNNFLNKILDNDEKILMTLKPSKKRFFKVKIILSYILCSFLAVFSIICGIIFYIKKDNIKYLILFIIISVFSIIFSVLYHYIVKKIYENTNYIQTNKRFIIISGINGYKVDYIYKKDILNIKFNIGFLDTLDKKNISGSLIFETKYNCLSPNSSLFAFKHVEDPCDIYSQITNSDKNKE